MELVDDADRRGRSLRHIYGGGWTLIERAAIRDEGYDPDDPAVVAALDRVRAELAAVRPGVPREGWSPGPPIGPMDELLDERGGSSTAPQRDRPTPRTQRLTRDLSYLEAALDEGIGTRCAAVDAQGSAGTAGTTFTVISPELPAPWKLAHDPRLCPSLALPV